MKATKGRNGKMHLTFLEAINLIDAVEDTPNIANVIAPNGKRFHECTEAYFVELAHALEDIAEEYEDELVEMERLH
jgi:hypothetical protein